MSAGLTCLSASVAERRSHSSGNSDPPLQSERPAHTFALRSGRLPPPAANDNRAPLLTKLRRLSWLLLLFSALLGLGALLINQPL